MTDASNQRVVARAAGFIGDFRTVSRRAIRLMLRDPEAFIPALIVGVFFYVVNVGALQNFVEGGLPGDFDYKAFQLPVALIFSVTGLSRAGSLVLDIQDGYFDRLLLTPVRRGTLLLGLMSADFTLILMLTIPVTLLGVALGVSTATGVVGLLVLVLMSGLWGLAFTGFAYSIALRTGNPTAVNNAFLLFFPFAFLTTAFVPLDQMTGWLAAVARFNPATYLLDGMRTLLMDGWEWDRIGKGFAAIALVGAISFSLAFSALRGRVKRV